MFSFIPLRVGNYLNEINNSKGLIIDLRGNPGGEMMSGINLFSYFINKPTVYSNFELFRKNGMDSYIISPNGKIHFSEKLKIIILGDERTSCSAELFINAMKMLDNVMFMASSRTSGLAMAMYSLIFPSGSIVALDCLGLKPFFSDERAIENKGIEPDIWVNRNSVYDLAPYNDKVLKRAKDIINMDYR
jgi:carboxyl-terminal processing protease